MNHPTTRTLTVKDEVRIGDELFVLTAELHQIGKQSPYFSLTYDGYELRGNLKRSSSSGAMSSDHPALAESKIGKYHKWHLVSVDDGPLHYLANAMYWGEQGNFDYFKNTIVFGEWDPDEEHMADVLAFLDEHPETGLPTGFVRSWLINRFDSLMAKFDADMMELFGMAYATDILGAISPDRVEAAKAAYLKDDGDE